MHKKPDSTNAMSAPRGWPTRASRRDVDLFSSEDV